ncbi:SagB family peptide dehydrogenase [Chloroflexota bacterium]
MADLKLSFRNDVAMIESPDNAAVILQTTSRRTTLKRVTPGLRAVLTTLASEGGTGKQLDRIIQQFDGQQAVSAFQRSLQQFFARGLICRSVCSTFGPIATTVPLTANGYFHVEKIKAQQKYNLSRFVYSHAKEGQMVLESPLSHACVILHHWLGNALVATLVQPHHCHEIVTQIPDVPEDTVEQFLSLLLTENMLDEFQENSQEEDTENLVLAQWDFHDLLFHTRSRRGRHANPTGNTLRFENHVDLLPVIKPDMSAEVIPLHQSDLEVTIANDAPFTQVLEERRSIRNYGDKPITVQQVGEFLYRSARVRNIVRTELGDLSNRPYPSGGAMYELEIYLAVNRCEGLAAGLYHYQPHSHQLHRLAAQKSDVEALLKDAAFRSMAQPEPPDVLVLMAARFQRVAWKYEGIAYALILKNVGVLQQTMHLVATAMGLAGCALGNGDSDLFARTAGTDYYAETSVGEFALGSLPTNKPGNG